MRSKATKHHAKSSASGLLILSALLMLVLSVCASPLLSQTAQPSATDKSQPAATAAAKTASSSSATKPAKATEKGDELVWVNTASGVYHKKGSRWYGKTKKGKYMLEEDAIKAGYKPAK
jgi:hypothetical protein